MNRSELVFFLLKGGIPVSTLGKCVHFVDFFTSLRLDADFPAFYYLYIVL